MVRSISSLSVNVLLICEAVDRYKAKSSTRAKARINVMGATP